MCFSLRQGENWITPFFSYSSLPCFFDLCSSISAHLFGKPMCGKLSNGDVEALSWRSLLYNLGVLFVASVYRQNGTLAASLIWHCQPR